MIRLRWPRIRFDAFFQASLFLWAILFLTNTAGNLTMPHAGQMAVRRAIVMSIAFLITQLMRPVLARTTHWPLLRRMLVSAVLSLMCGLGYGLVNYTAFYVVDPMWGQPESSLPEVLWNLAVLAIWVNLASCSVFYAINSEREAREKTIKLLSAENLAVDAANRMLRYQINPHFLFNTLNALATLVGDGDRQRAERIIFSLSNFLRHSLEHQPNDLIPLGEEIRVQREYLAIEQIRFGERMRLKVETPPDLCLIPVPSLILQPLLENAVKYGVSASTAPVTIRVRAATCDEHLQLTVEDDGGGILKEKPPRLGVGLRNVRERLAVIYGERASMSAEPMAGGGFCVVLRLPLPA